ncbi:periplasmic heavy metal sensor [Amaricoccus tamworthensis]|uniref:periplasmic heavy metal sensor n=1 Tax=Amaricoccus tamworthensis TaxID=57002 RepID=UPI003C7E0BFD
MNTDTPKSRRWIKWILIVSLGLNVTVLGLALGLLLKGPPPPKRSLSISWSNAETLPEPYRENLTTQIRELKPDWETFRETMSERRQAVADALIAEPFEIEAVRAAFAADRSVRDELQNQGTELLLDQITLMTADERTAYAENLLSARRK